MSMCIATYIYIYIHTYQRACHAAGELRGHVAERRPGRDLAPAREVHGLYVSIHMCIHIYIYI